MGMANVLIISRGLGPTGRGDVAFLMTVAVLSGYLTSLSVHEAGANFSLRGAGVRAALGTNSVILAVVLGAVASGLAILALAYLPFFSKSVPPQQLALALACIPLANVQTLFMYLARGSYFFTAAN